MNIIESLKPIIEERASEILNTFTSTSEENNKFLELLEKVEDPKLVFELENSYFNGLRSAIIEGYSKGIIELSVKG